MIVILHKHTRPQFLGPLLSRMRDEIPDRPVVITTAWNTNLPMEHQLISDQGQTRALWDAFTLFNQTTEDTMLTVLEDDVQWCRNAFRYMETLIQSTKLDHFDWFSWYNPESKNEWTKPSNWYVERTARYQDAPGHWVRFHGCSALTIPRFIVARLLEYDIDAYFGRTGRANAGDLVMTEALPNARVGWHVPSLFRHLGLVSSWYPQPRTGDGFETPTYPGDDFDALSLLR